MSSEEQREMFPSKIFYLFVIALHTCKSNSASDEWLAKYTLIEGVGHYRIGSEALSWSEAKMACERDGTSLLVLNSEEEKNLTVQLYSSSPDPPGAVWPGYAWIGLHDLKTEGVFQTVTGETLESVGYTNWKQGQPTSQPEFPAPIENCVDFHRTGEMSDTYCAWKLAYICEHPVVDQPEIVDVTTNSTDLQV